MSDEKQAELISIAGAGMTDAPMGLSTASGFALIQRVAACISSSTLVPKEYQGKQNLPNVVIALEMAARIGISPLAVMQNLYIVNGKPSWSSTFIIASINSCGRFNPLRFQMTGKPGCDDRTCIAWTTEREFPIPRHAQTLELARGAGLPVLEGAPVSIDLAKKEGWYTKNGSKWPNMSEQMLRYRAATFFGRLYAPDLLMGIRPADEVEDVAGSAVGDIIPTRVRPHVQPIEAIAGNGHEPTIVEPAQPGDPPKHFPPSEGATDKITEFRELIDAAHGPEPLSALRTRIQESEEWIGTLAVKDLLDFADARWEQMRVQDVFPGASPKRKK